MSEKIGRTIKARLSELGEGQAWLAEKVGVSINAVSKWTRSGKVARENIASVADALGLSVDALISGDDPAPVLQKDGTKLERLDADESALLALYRECKEGERGLLMTHAKLLAGSRAEAHDLFRRHKS